MWLLLTLLYFYTRSDRDNLRRDVPRGTVLRYESMAESPIREVQVGDRHHLQQSHLVPLFGRERVTGHGGDPIGLFGHGGGGYHL